MKILTALFMLFALASADLAHAEGDPILDTVRRIEADLGARVGLSIHDTGRGDRWEHRADERFPMASTFKVLACAALLSRADAGAIDPRRTVAIRQSDLLSYAPVTERRVGGEMSLHALCEATMSTSDNTAANMIIDALGGPPAVARLARGLGDDVTRLDRREPSLNEGAPGDPRDTSTPAAMAATFETLVLGDALSDGSRAQLVEWLVGNEVGGPLLRAGLPADWRVGDRTGAGGHGTRGIVAVLWPPNRAPLIAVVFITETDASMDARNAAIASIGATIAEVVSRRP
ncbi:class A beta-lactamase [Albimonas pacifica]|uniref:Beta-lactamase n=1 Tax=Albimonas pacifica TaxID=1114924 RepID=A0A1I3FTN7_9RHOB|nr:class A beta-lactamase [Albimonas pacifica]SFI14569.1 beta-lactamase class A CARB-5 [Albimonas pacifica]